MLLKPEACRGCVLYGRGCGYVPADGSGRNGVLVVLEAAGADEAEAGLPTVGRAGYYLWQTLKKVNLERDDFRIHNVLSCQPPNNVLRDAPYEDAAIGRCAPNLDATIVAHAAACAAAGLTPTILALGDIAFRRVMGIARHHPILKEDYHGYILEPEQGSAAEVGAKVVAAYHPSFLMRGQHQYVPTLQFAAQRACAVARGGFVYHQPDYLLDPAPATFGAWVDAYRAALRSNPAETFLSVDIETPHKAKKGEDKLVREDDEDYIILRCSFAYRPNEAVSIPWRAEYMPVVEDLLADAANQLVTWNGNYDIPRLRNQLDVRGVNHDAMLAWHVLNSALDKALGFVTPYYVQNARMWKHLSSATPAFYNAQDADMALQNYLGIRHDLIRAGQMDVFQRHVLDLNRILDRASATGLRRDETMRAKAEADLTSRLAHLEAGIQAVVPPAAKKEKVFARRPTHMNGVEVRRAVQTIKVCDRCGLAAPKKDHFKVYKKKVNPCGGASIAMNAIEGDQWYRPIAWKPSTVALAVYAKVVGHAVIRTREGRPTFDDDAITKLMGRHPQDLLYPQILDHRAIQKLRGTYIGVTSPETGRVHGGLRVGRDGYIHCELTHNPETLRLACQNPNMQNCPRVSGDPEALENVVRNLVVARDGCIFIEADFSAIEAVLVGYFARDPDYIRLSKLGIHAYLASHILGRPADLKWSDADLKAYFSEIKKSDDPRVQQVYNGSKRTIHLSGYGGTARKMHQAEPGVFPDVKTAERFQGIYWEIAAPVKTWQTQVQLEAHRNGYLTNPFSYVLRFTHVFRNVKEDGVWVRKPGDQANAALAFLPQSTAAGIIKECILRQAGDDLLGPALRLQIHDSLLIEVRREDAAEARRRLVADMITPIYQLPLPDSYGMGTHLSIGVDSKIGDRWGSMHG